MWSFILSEYEEWWWKGTKQKKRKGEKMVVQLQILHSDK